MKLFGLAVAAFAAEKVTDLLGGRERKLESLEEEYHSAKRIYEQKRLKLIAKISKGGWGANSASKELSILDSNFKVETERYEEAKNRLQRKKTKKELELEKIKLIHQNDMEKLKYEHELKMKSQAEQSTQNTPASPHEQELAKIELELERSKKAAEFEANYKNSNGSYSTCDKSNSNYKFCHHCGTKLHVDNKFCRECGKKL